MSSPGAPITVLAFGGNAIIRNGQRGTITEQFANARLVLEGVVDLVADGGGLIIVHGNGPQVGNELLRSNSASGHVPELPLGVLVADTEGGMGYMIQQSLQNVLWKRQLRKPVVTLLTQVVVDPDDPQLQNPSKPIGPFFSREEAECLTRDKGWLMKEDAGRGWRLVVPSPRPVKIVEHKTIKSLLASGVIVIAGGGGGIPITVEANGDFEGVDAVIDKDLTACLIGLHTGAETLIIATDVDRVALDYNTPGQRDLERMTVDEAQGYLAAGQFPAGSMGPKIEGAIQFLRGGGRRVIITSPDQISAALKGEAGTRIAAAEHSVP